MTDYTMAMSSGAVGGIVAFLCWLVYDIIKRSSGKKLGNASKKLRNFREVSVAGKDIGVSVSRNKLYKEPAQK